MFYVILALLLVLFYVFVAPRHIKGTINLMTAAFALVLLLTIVGLGFTTILSLSSEFWMVLGLVLLGGWAMRDIHFMKKVSRKR